MDVGRGRDDLLQAIDAWGDRLCAWACGVSVERLDELRDAFSEFPADLVDVAEILKKAGRDLPSRVGEKNPLVATTLAAARLVRIPDGDEHTLLNQLRQVAGGELPSEAHADPLVAAARWLGRDLLPAYLVLEAETGGPDLDREALDLGRHLLFEGAVDGHPAFDAFEAAFAGHDGMAPLREALERPRPLPGIEGKEVSGSIYLVGDALPPNPLVSARTLTRQLVEAAWERQLLSGDPDPSPALDLLPALLDELARGIRGESIEVPATVGLRGLAIPRDHPIRVRGGELRAATPHEWRRTHEDDPSAAVLQLRLDSGIDTAPEPSETRWDIGWSAAPWSTLAERAEEVALAAALALEEAHPPAVTIAWATIVGPVGEVEVLSREAGRYSEPAELDAERLEALTRWIALVRRHGSRLPKVARRRAVSALHERSFFADGLVDAVIALESIVGTGSPRLQAACAWLLAPDDHGERRRRYDEVDALYTLRSAVVHRGKRVVRTDWEGAVDVLRQVLRTLLENRPELLESGDIGTTAMLGG